MRLARIYNPTTATVEHAMLKVVENQTEVHWLTGSPIGAAEPSYSGAVDDLAGLKLLAPVQPSKVVAVGRNFHDHAMEAGGLAERPRIFFKPISSLLGMSGAIVLPKESADVQHEAELAVVIGRRARRVPAAQARNFIFGYTCANDVTARDIQRIENLPDFAKSFDTFCPLGPWIDTDFVPDGATVECLVNGETRQRGRVADMLTPIPELIEHITSAMTLEPGDVILTGTPAGVSTLHDGDRVQIRISGLGSLENLVTTTCEVTG